MILNKYLMGSSKSIKDYILLIRTNLKIFLIISLSILILAIAYALYAKNIYKSTVSIKINKTSARRSATHHQSIQILQTLDRFIANEIEVMNNYDTREKVALALIDSFIIRQDKSKFAYNKIR